MATLMVRDSTSIVAGLAIKPLANEQIEIAPWDGYLEVYIGGSASLRWTLTIGARQVVINQQADASAAFPTELSKALQIVDEETFHNERIFLSINNPTAGAITALFHIRLSTQKRTS